MKAHINEQPKYKIADFCGEAPMVHGYMTYRCKECDAEWRMWLQCGVEGKDAKQPCPFCISCHHCGAWVSAVHIDWHRDVRLPEPRPMIPGGTFFKFDNSGDEMACGMPRRCLPAPPKEDNR